VIAQSHLAIAGQNDFIVAAHAENCGCVHRKL
jgi:hypothetical protein